MTRVLVVDDELGIRETFQMILEEEGYDVATAADFFEAESLLAERPFDIVVTDIIMPRVNGLALLQRVREIDEDIPVIMITGEPDISTAAEAVRHGAYDYIAKPVTLDMLLHVVGRAAERKRLLDDKHRLEAENLAYQSDLERKVIERTAKLEQRREELAALIEIGRDTSATLNLDKVMEIVAESMVVRLGYKAALVSSYTEEDDSFTMRAMCPHGALLKQAVKLIGYDPWELKFSFDPQENPGFEQLLRGQVWLTTFFHDFVRPVLNKRVADALQRLYDIRYCICVPMWVRGKLVGVIVATSEAEIDTAAQEVLVSLARQAALAIENARLYEREQQRVAQRARMLELSRELRLSLDLSETLNRICLAVVKELGWQQVIISLRDYETQTSRPVAMAGYDAETVANTLALPPTPFGELDILREEFRISHSYYVDHQRRAAIADYPDELIVTAPSPELDSGGWHPDDMLLVPVEGREGILGFISPDNPVNRQCPTLEMVQELEAFANQAATAIENAHLFEAERAQLLLARTLQEVGALLTTRLSLDEVYRHIFDLLSQVIEYKSVSIQLVGADGQLDLLVERGFPEPERHRQIARELSSQTMELFAERKVIVIPDTHNDSRWVIVPCTEYIRSWIGAPLLVKGKFIGVLNVDSAVLDAYDVATGETVMAFANQAAVAIENARLYEEVQRRLESLTNLNRASQVIASSLDMREILEQVVELAGSVVESDYTSVMLLDEAGEPVLEAEDFRGVAPIARRIRGSGVARRVLDSGQPVVVDAISAEGAMNPPLRRPDGQLMEANPDIVAADIRSFAAVPIQAKGRMMGVAFVHSRQPRAFHGQIPLLTTFANQAAVAVENARLYEDQRKRAVQAESLLRIEQAINSSLELEPTLRTVVREMAQLMGVEQSGVMLFDEKCEYGYLTVEYQEAEGVALGEELRISLEGNLSIERILTTREPLAVYDAENDPCLSTIRDIVHLRHIKSILIAPLIVRGDVIGTIGFDATEAPRHFTEGEIRLSQILAGRAAIAIENARLFEETQKHVACLEKKTRDLELVHQVSQTVSSSLDLTRILEATVEQMVEMFEADHSGILLLDQAQTYGQVVAEYPSSGAAAERFPIQGYLVAERIIADREPLMIEDVWNDPLMATVREAMHRLDIRSMLIAPLIVKGEVLGSIGLDAVGQQRRFSAEEVALAQTIANQVAIAIENARLFEEAQRRVHQLSTLNRVGRRVASILDRQRLLQQAVNAVRDDLGYFRAAVLLVNEEENDLYVAAATDNFWRVIPDGYRQSVGKGAVGTAAQTRETVLVDDASSDPHAYRVGEWFSSSSLSVPIQVGGRVSGVLEVEADTVNAFDEGDRAVLELMADQLSIAFENARLFEAEQQRRREAETLYRATQALATTLDLRQVFERILSELQQVVPYDSASVQLLRGERLEIIGGHGFPNLDELLGITFDLSSEDNPNREVMRRRAPFIVDDAPTVYAEFRKEPHAAAAIRAYLGVPLLFGDRLIGMLALDKHEPGFYTAEHARLASAFAAQAAIAIENAHLYEETKQRAEEMTALHETTLDITAQLEMPRLLNAIIARASDLLGATGGLIHLYDLARERLTAVTSYNLEKDYTGLTLAVGEGVAGKVFQAGEPLVVDDHRTWSGKSPQLVDAAARSMLGVPLKWQERVIGVLDIVDNVRVGAFAEQDLRLLMPFANQAAIAIQNARLFEETRQRAGQWEALTEVGRAIGSILDLDEVLQLVLERLKQVIPYDTVSLWLRKGEVMRTRAVRGFEASEAHLDLTVTIEEDALSQEMVSTRRPLVIADAQRDERFHGLAGTEWVRSWLGVPLLSKGEVIGLATINKREPGLYTAEMAELALAFGQQAALAIENARLYAVQRQRAAQLESLNVIAATISQVLDLDEVLNLIVCQAAELMEAETMVIPLLGEDGTHLTYAAAHGRLAADLFGLVKPLRDTGICTWVLRNKQRFYSDDLAADERAGKEMKEALGLRTVISAPMIFKGEAIGAITAINRRDGGLFTRADLEERLQPLANHAAIAIGNAHLYEETKQRAEEMTALYHTSLEIGTPTDLPNLLWTICDRAVRLLGVSKGGLYLYDEAREELELAVSYKLELDFAGIRIGLGEGVAGRVVQTGQSLTVDDYSRWEGRAVTYEEEPFAAVIGVPLRWQGRIIGAITLSEEMKRRTFTSADERLLGLFAQQAAAAIESARLYGEARRHVEELTALHTIDVAIASTLNLDEVLERIYEQIGALMDIDAFHIALYNEEEDTFHVPIIVDKGERLPPQTLEGGLSGWVVRTREPLWIEDMEKERDTMPVEAIALSVPARSLMVWPLVTRDKVIGVISVQSTEPHAFDEGHRRLFSGIASQVAIAVENARLFEETNRRLDELSLLHEAALATAATLDSDEILRRTVEAVNNRLNLDVFGFLLLDEDADLIRLHPTFLGVPDEMADFSTPLGEGITGWVAQTGQPFLTSDVSKTSHYLDVIPGMRSEICVPLKVGDKVIGVINAESTQLNAFSEDDVRLFSTLASQLGVALDNARLFEETNRRLVEARLIQEVMLAAASTLDFDLVLERTVKALNRALGIKRLGFLLPDERNGVLSPHPSLVGFAGAAFQIPIKGSLAGHAYRTGQPMLVRDLARKPAYEGRAPDVRSVLAVPVRIANRIAAVLHAESNQVGAFGEDELLLFVTIAGQLGVTLNNAQLYQRLQEVNRSRTELVQNVGHELRTPLGLIKGYVELLRNGDLGPILDDQQSALQIVHERTIALTRLIRNLTVLQALPKEALTLAPLSLVALARRVLEEFRGSAARASVTFLEELPAELPDVMGDREQLKLAFGHLLDNAIKFSPDGGVVAIRAWAKRGMVCVSIADEGIGISSEHLEHIFERFYQVDGSASRRFGGMGVGLALVWEVIEAHGGTVDVDSEAGGGSTFTVALPQATDLESS